MKSGFITEKNGGCSMDNSREFQLMLDEAIKSEPSAFEGFDKTKNIQSQLQEMLEDRPSPKLFTRFLSFLGWDGATFTAYNYSPKLTIGLFTSMEQLWLAFVMFQLYKKKWDNGEWRLEENRE